MFELNMDNVQDRQSLKIQILRMLYERRDFGTLGISFFDLVTEMHLDNKAVESIIDELENDRYIEFTTTNRLRITVHGMDEIERRDSDRQDVRELKSNRLLVLRQYYNIRDEYHGAAPSEIARQLNLEENIIEDIVFYYRHKGFLMSPALGPNVKITYQGVREVKRYSTPL